MREVRDGSSRWATDVRNAIATVYTANFSDEQATEMVFPDPDDLFLAPDSAMVVAIAPGAFTYG